MQYATKLYVCRVRLLRGELMMTETWKGRRLVIIHSAKAFPISPTRKWLIREQTYETHKFRASSL